MNPSKPLGRVALGCSQHELRNRVGQTARLDCGGIKSTISLSRGRWSTKGYLNERLKTRADDLLGRPIAVLVPRRERSPLRTKRLTTCRIAGLVDGTAERRRR